MNIKAGFVGILGEPNAGKSTLINFLVSEKVSIISSKPQTTRRRNVGILSETTKPQSQIIFLDAPGFVKSNRLKKDLYAFLSEESEHVIEESDVVIAVLNPLEKSSSVIENTLELCAGQNKKCLAVISHVDQGKDERIFKISQICERKNIPVWKVNLKQPTKEFKDELLQSIRENLPDSPGFLYDPELYTTEHMRELSCEIIREKCFESLFEEVPFGCAVRIITFKDDLKIAHIDAEIWVKKENHQGIVIGKKGEMLKKIATDARIEIEKLIGKKVFLEVHVKTKKSWDENPIYLKELGYENRK